MKHVLLVLLTASFFSVSAQKASGKLTFTKGQKLEVVTTTSLTSQSMMGPSSGTIVTSETYTVGDATGGAYTLVKIPKQMKMNFSMGSQEMSMDTDNPKDLEGPMGEPIKEIMSQKPEFTIDANGKIIAVKESSLKKDDNEQTGMMGMMLPGLDMSGGLPKEGGASFFQILPAREVSAGDTWKDSINADGNKYSSVYKVKEITDNEIVLDYTTDGVTEKTQEAMGMKIDVNVVSNVTGTIRIDRATGIMKQKTATNTSETSMNVGGQAMTLNSKATAVTNVTTL